MAKSFLNKRQIKRYQKNMDKVYNSFNREILVYVGSGIPSDNFDPVNFTDIDPNVPLEYDDVIYRVENVLISWITQDNLYQFLPGGRVVPGDVILKARIDDVLASGLDRNNDTIFDLPNCRKILVDGQTVKPKERAVKGGLKDLYTCSILCERVENV